MRHITKKSAVTPARRTSRHEGARFPAARLRPSLLAWSIAGAFAAVPSVPMANPQGGVAVHGTATMNYQGKTLNVTTTNGAGTSHSAINWQSFSIPVGNSTYIQQPNAVSTSLNRVVTNTPSQIYGTLGSNGKVVLVNQSGIAVGAGAVVDTAGFTASALGMSEADAKAGRLRFDGAGVASGGITVQGNVIARNGDVVLISPNIQVDAGAVIEAPNGAAILAAGQKVEVTGRGLEGIRLEVQAPSDRAVNLGTLKGDAVGIFATSLRHSGLIRATGVTVEGGRVVLKATELAEVNGRVEASRAGGSGGSVEVSARVVTLNGVVEATGTAPSAAGGSIVVSGQAILQGGTLDASGAGAGGSIAVVASKLVEQTALTRIRADGGTGAGGTVRVQATDAGAGYVMSSAEISADGASGGTVQVLAPEIRLLAANVRAEGTSATAGDGGTIEVGGGKQGQNPNLPNSRRVFINNATNLSASSRRSGKGGTVIVWSDGVTRFAGNAFARGGSEAGDGGFIEVSGKESLTFEGMANAGATQGAKGVLLLDPKNIVIDDVGTTLTAVGLNNDPDNVGNYLPGTDSFGTDVFVSGGKIVVVDPYNDAIATDGGAIYAFHPTTGALLGSLKGSHAGDHLGKSDSGSGRVIQASPLDSSNELLIVNPGWNANAGAITFFRAGSVTSNEVVSDANSFVGANAGDSVGSGGFQQVYGPAGTGLLFGSPEWGGGKGSVLMVSNASGDTARSGFVNDTTSLVGKTTDDHIGRFYYGGYPDYFAPNTEVIVAGGEGSSYQNSFVLRMVKLDGDRGAVTLGKIGVAMTGEVGASGNVSLTGTTAGDRVGENVIPVLIGSEYGWVIASPNWTNTGYSASAAGAVTVISGATAALGPVSATNSLVGTHSGDSFGVNDGYGGQLYNRDSHGYFLVANSGWDGGKGAVTHINLAAPAVGEVGGANSLVGSIAGDNIGGTIHFNDDSGNYFVVASNWGGGSGAVTWGSAANGVKGAIDDSVGQPTAYLNSIVGKPGDYVGQYTQMIDDKLLVLSPQWANDHYSDSNMGAITVLRSDASPQDYLTNPVGDGSSRIVSATNSVVGSVSGDAVGFDSPWGGAVVSNLGNNWWAVGSPSRDSGKGAVTFIYTGSDTLSSGNAAKQPKGVLVAGSTTNLSVLGTNAYYYDYGEGGSDYEFYGDRVGAEGQVQASPTQAGKVALINADWNHKRGAVTMLDLPAMTQSIEVDATNSLVGSTPVFWDYYCGYCGTDGDQVGDRWQWSKDGTRLIVIASDWNYGDGAVAVTGWGANNNVGAISSANAFVGSGEGGDEIGSDLVMELNGGKLLIASPEWNDDRGAVSILDMNSVTGTVDPTPGTGNSMVGEFSGDWFGEGLTPRHVLQTGGMVVVASPQWRFFQGAITWINAASPGGVVNSATNSLVGANTGDQVGAEGFIGPGTTVTHSGEYPWSSDYVALPYNLALSPEWSNGKGAITRIDETPKTGVVSATNSFVGAIDGGEGDKVGSNIVYFNGDTGQWYADSQVLGGFDNGALVLTTQRYADYGAKALTVFAPDSLVTGTLGSANSVELSSSDTYNMNTVRNGNYVLLTTPNWDGGKGAIRVLDTGATASAGVTATRNTGATSSSNALVGSASGDYVGSGYTDWNTPVWVADGKYLVGSPQWSGNFGAITLVDLANAPTGTLGAANSLVGNVAYSFGNYNLPSNVLGAALTPFSNGSFLLLNPYYGGTSGFDLGQGAVTFINPNVPLTGTMGSDSYSLYGGASNVGNGLFDVTGVGEISGYDYGRGRPIYGSYVVHNEGWNNDTGMATVFNQTGPNPTGVVSAANSLVGSAAGDRVGYRVFNVDSSHFVVASPSWNSGTGAITWGTVASGTASLKALGVVSATTNSLTGSHISDFVGDGLGGEGHYSPVGELSATPGSYYVVTPSYDGGKGAYTFVTWGQLGTVNDTNSIVSPYASGLQGGSYNGSDRIPEYVGNGLYTLRFAGMSQWGGGPGQVILTNASVDPGPYTGGLTFADAAGDSVTITPGRITDITNNGTSVLLQANNDITVNADIITVPVYDAGDLVMEAGRSILVNANIDTGGGNLMLWANSAGANAAHRDAGAGGITMAAGTTITLGGGDMVAKVDTGAGGGKAGGSIHLGTIIGGEGLFAQNLSTTPGAGITQESGANWGVVKLAMETTATNGNIGTLAQPITFDGEHLAVRTAGGPADIQHTGTVLYISSEGLESVLTAPTTPTINADPGWRGIELGGLGSLNLTSEGFIEVEAGSTNLNITAHNIYIGAQNYIDVYGDTATANISARNNLTIETPNLWVGGGYNGGKARVHATNDVNLYAYGIAVYGGEGVGSEGRIEAGQDLKVRANEFAVVGGDGTDTQAIVKAGRDIDFSLDYKLYVIGGYYGSGNTARVEAGRDLSVHGPEEEAPLGNEQPQVTIGSPYTQYLEVYGGEGQGATSTIQVGRDLFVKAAGVYIEGGEGLSGSFAEVNVARNAQFSMGGGYNQFVVHGGYNTGNHARVSIGSFAEVTGAEGGSFYIDGGSGENAHASFVVGRSALITLGGTLGIHGGSGNGAFALLDPQTAGSTLDVQANAIDIQGGSGDGSYAAMISFGPIALQTNSVNLAAGTGANSDGVILSTNGQALSEALVAAGCATCGYLGVGNQVLNGSTVYGVGQLGEEQPILPRLIADEDLLDQFLDLADEDLLRRRRAGRDDVVFENTCPR
jgi:filamentous hemagglutinin family protein